MGNPIADAQLATVLNDGAQPGTPVKALKFFGVQIKAVDDVQKMITFMATTKQEDRDRDIIIPEGGRFENYRQNPVFLWAHDWMGTRLPIGKSLAERILPGTGVEMDIQFDEKDAFAMEVYRKYKEGYLNAVSIGFIGKKWAWRNPDIGWAGGREYQEWEMLELSGCPVPSNPGALQQRFAKFLQWAEKHPDGQDRCEKCMTDSLAISEMPFGWDNEARVLRIPLENNEMMEVTLDVLKQFRPRDIAALDILQKYRRFHNDSPPVDELVARLLEDEQKAGAVLNRKNKSLLKEAQERIQTVLDSAEPRTHHLVGWLAA